MSGRRGFWQTQLLARLAAAEPELGEIVEGRERLEGGVGAANAKLGALADLVWQFALTSASQFSNR
ncbi:MAG: hypothetical protein NTX13_05715 [Acidobacteria bacterium]|nr:hypothetical protein [Acidobacteriota bacterium]